MSEEEAGRVEGKEEEEGEVGECIGEEGNEGIDRNGYWCSDW